MRATKRRSGRWLGAIGWRVGIALGVFFSVMPVLWLVLTSFRPQVDIFRFNPQWIPKALNLKNYRAVFRTIDLGQYLNNTFIVSISVTIACLIVGSLAGYALARYKFRGSSAIQGTFLIGRMLPIVTALVPLFLIIASLRLLDTYAALIIVHTAFKLPVTIWLMQAYVSTIPIQLEEAARLDGCNTAQLLTRVTGPLVLPGVAAAGIIAFLFTWNDLIIALVIASSKRTQPMSVGLTNFFMEHGIDWGPMSAAAVIMVVPALLFAFFAQRYLIHGLTAGSVKG